MSLPLAVIGAGEIGGRHIGFIAAEPACHLAALADPDPATERLAQQAGAAYFADYRAMLAAAKPAGVIVATPNETHAEVGIACAEAGVPLLVEKPMVDSVAAGRRLLEAAERNGIPVSVGHHRRFDPAIEATAKLLRDGAIGTLLAITAIWAQRKPGPYFDVGWRTLPDSGGPVLINLIHDIDLLRLLCGEIDSVYAETGNRARGFAVEDTAALVLRFRSGALAGVMLSDAAASPWGWEAATGENPGIHESGQNCYRFLGTGGSLDFPNLVLWRYAAPETDGWKQRIHAAQHPTGARAALAAQLRHFCRVVRGEAPPRVSGRDGLATLAATLAVRQSAASGKPVKPAFTL